MNEGIVAPEVRVIGSDGQQIGVMHPSKALELARQEELDLVEIASAATPPVVRIMDFGKYKYSVSKKDKTSRKKSASSTVKTIRLSPATDDHDLLTKARMVKRFVEEGSKVKVIIWFRGRMITHQEFGVRMMQRIAEEVAEVAKPEAPPRMEGHNQLVLMLIRK
ncbi:translation initiation factor IF-3 [bacterium]|nr:translation initiation factor IF-3 [bacterium]